MHSSSMSRNRGDRTFRLLVVSHLFAPDVCGGASIFSDMCCGLAERGIDVTVRCGYPYYPEWKDKSGHNGIRIQRGEYKGDCIGATECSSHATPDPRGSGWSTRRRTFCHCAGHSLVTLGSTP